MTLSFRRLAIGIYVLAVCGGVSAMAIKNSTDHRPKKEAVVKKPSCLDSSANDTTINLAFFYGGAGTTVNLCQGAVINIFNPIYFTAPKQALQTVGKPSDDNRATINVASNTFTTAVFGACGDCGGVYLGYVIVNGNRPLLGFVAATDGGTALLEMGGNGGNQIIEHVWAFEPRGWSALHAIEGADENGNPICAGMIIRNNRIGPSGNSANQGPQFKRDLEAYRLYSRASLKAREASGVNPPGQWADGISLACKNSQVIGNTIVDATDGGIVIFGAPGSQISKNTIIASTRNLLGGINLVDYAPWQGDYTGTLVNGNIIQSNGAMIKNGIAIGTMVWGSFNRTSFRTSNGIVRNNLFLSNNGGYFGYGIAAAGHNNTNIAGNVLDQAVFNGTKSLACIPPPFAPPAPQKLVFDPSTSYGTFQKGFASNTLVFLICLAPTNAQDTSGWTKRSATPTTTTSVEIATLDERESVSGEEEESFDTLVARNLAEAEQGEDDEDHVTRKLARAIAESDWDEPPAPRATGVAKMSPPSYLKRAQEEFYTTNQVEEEKRQVDVDVVRMMSAVDKRAFASIQ